MHVKSLLLMQLQIFLVVHSSRKDLMNSTLNCSTIILLFTFGLFGLVGSEDGHEELLAAVKGVINSGLNLTEYYLYLQPKMFPPDGVVWYFSYCCSSCILQPLLEADGAFLQFDN